MKMITAVNEQNKFPTMTVLPHETAIAPKIETRNVNLYYGDYHALKNISIGMNKHEVVALIGPSGCGKSTYLRLFNRMNDLIDNVRIEGEVMIDNKNIYAKHTDVDALR